jgi:uncharacterized protein YecT (DUF1311 family)
MKTAIWTALLLAALAPGARAAELNEADAQAICARFQAPPSGANARVSDADRKLFARSDCAGFVYAEPGRGRDYDKARRCCLAQGGWDRELAILFANGWGTPRNYDAATYFLCKAESIASAELWGMLGHLQEMRQAPHPKDLDYCDWVTSGAGMSICAGRDLDALRPKVDRQIAAAARGLSAEAKAALDVLSKAADAFAEKDGVFLAEPTQGGTGHNSFVVAYQIDRTETWAATLERYAAKRSTAATAETFNRADADLNTAYKSLRAKTAAEKDVPGGPKALLEAQRAWLQYRDAWTAFYRLRWQGAAAPEALEREIRTALTRERIGQLQKGWEEG